MDRIEGLPRGWEVWNEEPGGRVVLAYRPDVFDGGDFPAECLPTIAVAPGRSPDRPAGRRERSAYWHVALYLEPAVRIREVDATHERREDAVSKAIDVAADFAAGEIDYREAYQVPREDYFAELDALVGEGR